MVRRRAGGASGLVVFVFLAWAQQAAEAAETCSARGFSGLQLCSDCEIFAQHVRSSKELVADCFECCAQDSAQNDGAVKYLNAYPFVKEFIMQHRREYPQVRVNYVNGSPPSLTLITDDNDESDQLRMDSWKLEDILEFLQNTFKG